MSNHQDYDVRADGGGYDQRVRHLIQKHRKTLELLDE
jgi:hypothetical protein